MGEEENSLRDFLISCLRQEHQYGNYLHFQVSDILPIQNLVENMVWTLLNNQPNKRSINQVTMGLLFLHLMHHTDRIRSASSSFDQQLIFQVLKFIDENYRDGQLTDLAAQLGYEIPWLSRAIKRLLGRTYKELLQIKRLNQAAFLLQSTRLPITDICAAVGYDNTSYFHRIFREYYHMSPKEYRCQGIKSPYNIWFTHIAPYGRMLIRYALPSPMAFSMYATYSSTRSFGSIAMITPAKPPPVDPACAALLLCDEHLRQCQCDADALFLDIAVGVAVLQPFPGGIAGRGDSVQKIAKTVLFQSPHLCFHPFILLKEMKGTKNRTISCISSQFCQMIDHILLFDLGTDLLAKELCYFFHLIWNGRIVRA